MTELCQDVGHSQPRIARSSHVRQTMLAISIPCPPSEGSSFVTHGSVNGHRSAIGASLADAFFSGIHGRESLAPLVWIVILEGQPPTT